MAARAGLRGRSRASPRGGGRAPRPPGMAAGASPPAQPTTSDIHTLRRANEETEARQLEQAP